MITRHLRKREQRSFGSVPGACQYQISKVCNKIAEQVRTRNVPCCDMCWELILERERKNRKLN